MSQNGRYPLPPEVGITPTASGQYSSPGSQRYGPPAQAVPATTISPPGYQSQRPTGPPVPPPAHSHPSTPPVSSGGYFVPSEGQTHNLPPPPVSGSFPPPPVSGSFPPPPVSGSVPPPPVSGTVPPPPISGTVPPPPVSVRPPPMSGSVPPPMGGSGHLPPPMSGSVPPPMGGSGHLPPPMSGSVPPPVGGSGHLPPPMSGSVPPPMGGSGHLPPPMSGSVPPPMGGSGHLPPPMSGSVPPPMGGSGHPPPMSGFVRPPPVGGSVPPPMGGGVHPPPPVGISGAQTVHAQVGGGFAPPPMGTMSPPVPPPQSGNTGVSSGFPHQPQYASGASQPAVMGGGSYPPGTQPVRPQPGVRAPELKDSDLPRPPLGLYNYAPQISDVVPAEFQAHPGFLRMTFRAIPASPTVSSKLGVPVGLIVQPMPRSDPFLEGTKDKESPLESVSGTVPVVNLGSCGIVRCRRCRAYINSFASFIDGGRRYQCNFCRLVNDVPPEYFSPLDVNGKRVDLESRPELTHGSVEFCAPGEYMVRPPQPPAYVFVIDASAHAVRMGLTAEAVAAIRKSLDVLPGDTRTRVGIITFASAVHCYSLNSETGSMCEYVVPDVKDPFLPVPGDLVVNLEECRTSIDALLDRLPNMCTESSEGDEECAVGAAIRMGVNMIHATGGKLCVMTSGIPSYGVGQLRGREDMRLYGTDKEVNLLRAAPGDPGKYYRELATECVKQQVCVDLFVAASNFADVATLAQLPRFTAGDLKCYFGYRAETHGQKLKNDIIRVLTRETGFEAVMRVRGSVGVKLVDYNGHFFLRSNDLLALPNADADKSFSCTIEHTTNMITAPFAYIQAALLYTTAKGERRICVHTLQLPVINAVTDMYAHADAAASAAFLARIASGDILSEKKNLQIARQKIQEAVVTSLRTYQSVTVGGVPSHLALPENFKHLPLLCLALLKNAFLRADSETRADERVYHLCSMVTRGVYDVLPLILPKLERISHGPKDIVPLSRAHVDSDSVYIMDNGVSLLLAVGENVSDCDTQFAEEVIIRRRRLYPAFFRMSYQVRVGEGSGAVQDKSFHRGLVEDRMVGAMGYAEFMAALHQPGFGER